MNQGYNANATPSDPAEQLQYGRSIAEVRAVLERAIAMLDKLRPNSITAARCQEALDGMERELGLSK